MKVSEQIRELVKHRNTTITELATNIDTTQANLANKLVRDKFRLSDIQEIAEGLNYDHLEIVLRGNNETVIIQDKKPIKVIHDTKYLVYDDVSTLSEEFEKYGINNNTFGDVVMALIEEELENQYGDLWSTTIPKRLENQMVAMALGVAENVISSFADTHKED